MKIRLFSKKLNIVVSFILFTSMPLILSSCRSKKLEAAQEFGSLAQNLNASNQKISKDIYGSCARSATWESLGGLESSDRSKDQLDACNESFLPNSMRAENASQVLIDYGLAIGSLATDSGDFNTQFSAISDALGNLSVNGITINENVRNAGVGIANFITNLLVRGIRQKNLKLAIICTDSDIQEYSTGLSKFYQDSYVDFLLDKEVEQINEYYGFYVTQVNKKLSNLADTNNDRYADFELIQKRQTTLEAEQREKIAEVAERKEDGAAYVSLINSTASFHGKLKRIFNDNKSEIPLKLEKKCEEYRTSNEELVVYENLEEKRKFETITIPEMAKAYYAMNEYITEIKPLISEIQE